MPKKEMFLAQVEWVPVISCYHITHSLTDKCKFSMMFSLFYKVDGLSLLTSSLYHWLAFGDKCPHILLSTHFHRLTSENLLPDTKLIEYLVRKKNVKIIT